jgi:hypothetical protein
MTQLSNRRWLKATRLSRAANIFAGSKTRIHSVLLLVFCAIAVAMPGCAGTTSRSTGPGVVIINVVPTSASLFLGQTQQFQAIVTGTSNTSVTWFAGGVPGGNANTGTISSTGLYVAPSVLPMPPGITVTALSNADQESTASAVVTLKDDIVVGISPTSASLSTGAGQSFTANVSGTGCPATGVTWSVNGVEGGNTTFGTVVSSGINSALYVAPAAPPSPPTVSVTVTSVADAAKVASASVTITCAATNSIAPPAATVALAQTQSFIASFCLSPGTIIGWDVNGIPGGNTAVGTIAPTGVSGALYSAPSSLPSPSAVAIHASNGNATATAAVTLISNISVSVIPTSATLPVSQRKSFAATLTNTADMTVTWLVNGISNGNATVGQVCHSGSSPCVPPASATANSIDYLAPASVPATNPVTLTAVSHADPAKSGNAIVGITGVAVPISVAISPFYAFVAHSTSTPTTLQFFATVTGSSNTNVTWSLQSAVPGQGCSGTACGSVDGNGVFTAPTAAPSPNAISIVATDGADATKSAAATIAITSGPTIKVILPSSVMAGAVEGFPLALQGVGFVAGSGGTGSVISFNGTARGTTCSTTTSCATALNPADVQSAATFTVQVKNPGSPGALSNPVPFVVVPFDASEDIVALNSSQTVAASKDIIVVEPTTAASSAAIDVDFDGFLISGGCEVEGTPISVTRPSSGSTPVSICIHGNGLDPTFTYVFTGPGAAPGDIPATASTITGLFPNTIELDFQISSTTLPGVRTLFITTLNDDRAAASGILEVK